MKTIYGKLEKNSNKPYNTRLVSRCLVLLKRSRRYRTLKKQNQLRLIIFHTSSKLFVKAVNNFFSLTQNISKEKIIHSKEDVALECFIVMNSCIDNLKMCNLKKFYFYLNTSLNRAMFRLYERNYKKHFDIVANTEGNELKASHRGFHDNTYDLFDVDLKGFTELELELIKFKMSGEKISDFLKKQEISMTEYDSVMHSVKAKLIDLYGADFNIKQ